VSALDVSEVALNRARAAARRACVDVEWIHAGLLKASLGDRVFDLVSVQYPALLRTPSNTAEHAPLASMAPGGHLLVVHHVLDDRRITQAKSGGFDPAAHVWPADVAHVLDDDWTVEFEAGRPRNVSAGAHHNHDVVLHVQRRV
jgi:hypothetical protein